MKKIILFLLFAGVTIFSFGQTKVAVYAPEENASGFDKETKDFVVGEFVRAINQSPQYIAVNRSREFEAGISSESSYQHSGLVNEKEIAQLGKRSGASLVCVVVFRRVLGDLNIEARLIDVVREEITVSDNRIIKNLDATSLMNDAAAMSKTIIEGGNNNRQTVYVRSYNDQLIFDKSSESKLSGYRNGVWESLSKYEVQSRLSTCPEAYQLYNSGFSIRENWRDGETIVVVSGLGFALSSTLLWMNDTDFEFNRDSPWATVTGILIGIPIAYVLVTEIIAVPLGNYKIKKAVRKYNESPYIGENLELRMGLAPYGIGLTLNF